MIRSLINFQNVSSYNLVKYWDSLIREKLNFVTDISIQKHLYFHWKIHKINFKMISLDDVKNVFSFIPEHNALYLDLLKNRRIHNYKFGINSMHEIIQ